MSEQDHRESGRENASADAAERRPSTPLPESNRNTISNADRAANPIGTAKREREQQQRDEAGKFARGQKQGGDKPDRQGERQQQDQGGAGDEPGGDHDPQQRQVPQGALRAERDKRQASEREAETLRRELAELRGMVLAGRQQPTGEQKAPTAPDFWVSPEDRMRFEATNAISPLQQQLDQQRMHFSMALARQQYGDQTFEAAKNALRDLAQSDPAAFQRFEQQASRSMDPMGDVVRWHKQQTAMREIGDDPAAYRERLRQELLAEMQNGGGEHHEAHQPHQQQPAAQRPPAQQQRLPTSFAATPGGGPRGGPQYAGPRPLSEIMPRDRIG